MKPSSLTCIKYLYHLFRYFFSLFVCITLFLYFYIFVRLKGKVERSAESQSVSGSGTYFFLLLSFILMYFLLGSFSVVFRALLNSHLYTAVVITLHTFAIKWSKIGILWVEITYLWSAAMLFLYKAWKKLVLNVELQRKF